MGEVVPFVRRYGADRVEVMPDLSHPNCRSVMDLDPGPAFFDAVGYKAEDLREHLDRAAFVQPLPEPEPGSLFALLEASAHALPPTAEETADRLAAAIVSVRTRYTPTPVGFVEVFEVLPS